MTTHPFDTAVSLTPRVGAAPGSFAGASSPAYWNMVGPFGGTTAATALQAVMQHPDRLGEPIALTVNYAAALGPGAFTVQATPVRTNRSTQHWTVALSQPDAAGGDGVVMTATAVTAVRRDTWGVNDTPMPAVAAPADVARLSLKRGVEWVHRYEMRPLAGMIPAVWDGGGTDSLTRLWVRDDPPRPLDFASLAALSDVFFPRVWLRRATPVPVGTVSMTVHFHADSRQLAESGEGFLLGQAQAQAFRNGFFDQTAQLWTESGTLLVTTSQIVYYKE
jgi:acyl-CoA thioesterase